jgi:hypothetical protein
VTRSEIPQLEVITAIPDADSEDFLAQLLFSQGWSIIFRAFDSKTLKAFLLERGVELRTVIVYQGNFIGIENEILQEFNSPTLTFISLDEMAFTSHEIMERIRGSLRAPLLQSSKPEENQQVPSGYRAPQSNSTESSIKVPQTQPGVVQRINRPPKTLTRDRSVVAITGSTGAPGRTRFAISLANEFASKGSVLLLDADIRSQGAAFKVPSKKREFIEMLPLDRESRPTKIPEGSESAVVDLGVLPALAEAVNDRRWYGSLVNNVLDQATHLVYVSKATSTSMTELAQFIREYPLLLKRLPVTYICVLTGHSRELREWESKFLTLTMGENRFILREGDLQQSQSGGIFPLLPFFRGGSGGQRSIAKIAAALK